MKKIAILGSTGSIGSQALDVIRSQAGRFEVVALAAHRNIELLSNQCREFQPTLACLTGVDRPASLPLPPGGRALSGDEGLVTLVEDSGCDLVLNAVTGAAGLLANLRAADLGKDLAIANKESLVIAGELLFGVARRTGCRILPIDSEHSAVFQCLRAGSRAEIRRIFLTASGGPFRGYSREKLRDVTVDQALRHPTWNMGPKITIDSATLMNKALEVLEANVLFDLPPDQIEVLVHPQSVVHSLVEYHDGSLIGHLGAPDMRVPIQYALSHPERWARPENGFSLLEVQRLEFEPPDHDAFPSIRLAYRVCRAPNSARVVFNAANEVAVRSFLDGRIRFLDIFALVTRALDEHDSSTLESVPELLEIDRETRNTVTHWSSPTT